MIDAMRLERQWNNNVFAVDEEGAYIVTNGLNEEGECVEGYLWAFGLTEEGKIVVRWKSSYENSGVLKPGLSNVGSGTTPSISVTKDGVGLVSIVDNAQPMNVCAYNREDGTLVSKVPYFDDLQGGDEASLIAVGKYITCENNYNHVLVPVPTPQAPNAPGMGMFQINNTNYDPNETDGGNISRLWTLPDTHFYAMNMLCRESGIIFANTADWSDPVSETEGALYSISAIDSYDGRIIWQIPLGRGAFYTHDFGGLYFNRKNTLIMGTNYHVISIQTVGDSGGGCSAGMAGGLALLLIPLLALMMIRGAKKADPDGR